MLRNLISLLPNRRDYDAAYLRQDLLAGLSVAVVALPLALAFGVTSGAGAAAGLFTAIVAGVLAAMFGGSNFQVSGPTGAMTVVLLPIVAQHGPQVLVFVGALAGVFLMVLALARIGRYVNYIPWPVIAGFTNGVAIIIFLQQLPGLLGVAKGAGENIVVVSARTLASYLEAPGTGPLVLGSLAIVVMLGWSAKRVPKALRAIPGSMAALVVVTSVSLLPLFDVPRIGAIPRSLPTPQLPVVPWGDLNDLVRAALVIAALAALESLLSAVVADGMTIGERHDPNRELFGQGLANIGSSLFGGIPATAALARTAVNVRSGARTRLAAITHGVVLFAIVTMLSPLASQIPLAALAGILMVVAVRMIELEAFRIIMRTTKSDAFVFLLTMVVTVAFDLILAIEIGLIAAGALFIVRMSRLMSVDHEDLLGEVGRSHHEGERDARAERSLYDQHVVAYRIDGPIFFGAADRFFTRLLQIDDGIEIVILRLRRVPLMDATGVSALRALVERLARRKVRVYLTGLQQQPRQLLERSGVLDTIGRDGHCVFATTEQAIDHALAHLRGT